MARVSHPNVIPVFDVGMWGDQVFVAMELVDGGTLGTWLKAEQRPGARCWSASWRRAGGSRPRTTRGWCTATSSPPTCWWAARAASTSRTSGWRGRWGTARGGRVPGGGGGPPAARTGGCWTPRSRQAGLVVGTPDLHVPGAVPGHGAGRAHGPIQLLRGALRRALRHAPLRPGQPQGLRVQPGARRRRARSRSGARSR